MNKVGFIGLGNIGMPMAQNLAKSAFTLQVFDMNPAAVAELTRMGAASAPAPGRMAADCEVVCICVRDDHDVEQVLNGADGIFREAPAGLHVVIHSTVTSGAFARWTAQAEQRGVILVDAAITGGAIAVVERNLCYMVGATEETLDYLRPVFEVSTCGGGAIIHAGACGKGLILKLANNTMAFFAFVAIHEAARLVETSGGALEKLYQVGAANGVVTPQMKRFMATREALLAQHSEAEFRRQYQPFATLVEKDLSCALQSAADVGAAMPSTQYLHGVIRQVFLNEC